MTLKTSSQINNEWRNMNVNRDRCHENLIHHLVTNPQTSLFRFNKDLMVFAAMLGYHYGIKKPLSSDTIQIVLGTYHSTEDDGFIYLLALIEKRDAKYLKNENLSEAIKIFEEYCNGGLDLLQDWFASNPADIEKIDTLEQKVLAYLQTRQQNHLNHINNDELEIEF